MHVIDVRVCAHALVHMYIVVDLKIFMEHHLKNWVAF